MTRQETVANPVPRAWPGASSPLLAPALAWVRSFEGIGVILAAGLLARFLVMPFATHGDALDMAWRGAMNAYTQPYVTLETLLRYFHAGYLRLIAGLLPPPDAMWPGLGRVMYDFSGNFADWNSFISQPAIYRFLFLLKLPFLLFDLACALVLYRIGERSGRSVILFTVWWLNPLLFFATYIFGRHEVIGLFFVLLSLLAAQRGAWARSLLALGVALAIRYYVLLLMPFYILSIPGGWRKRVVALLAGLLPWLVVNVVTWLMARSSEVVGLAAVPHDNYLLAAKLPLASWDTLYIFPLVYLLVLLHRSGNGETGLASLRSYCTAALSLMFALSYTGQSAHYWTWLLPWLTLSMVEQRPRLLWLHGLQLALLIAYTVIGDRSIAGYLFGPVSPDFFWSLPGPAELITRFMPVAVFVGLAHTALAAVTLWMAYLTWARGPEREMQLARREALP